MCLISVIIVNWNGINLLRDCLDAVLSQDFSDFEVILVDNGSSDGSPELVQKNYPTVCLLRLEENRGFTGGNLAGLDQARGSFIALLNNDTRPEKRWLGALYRGMVNDNKIGISASKIIIDGTDMIDSVGDIFTTAFTGTKLGSLSCHRDFSTRMFVHGACAAAALYRREMMDEIGFLDDDFFFNHEDTDFNLRAWLSGWKCIYVPEAVVYHKVSASLGTLNDNSVYYFSRNNVWVWIKNVPSGCMFRYLHQRLIYELSSFAFFCFMKGKWVPYLRGKFDSMKKIPIMLNKRKAIQKNVKLSNYEIAAGLMPIAKYLKQRLKNIE
ncbi:glycosyltransferase [Geobacter sp. FeAm09]|uniref:glycosyltransferase family 2 protein n=1 Tax=Geobacter sp. FeAm09 TaxID=2597769 RepID=UPI0011F07C34|nr:glycosyltransferase family 2 protein [Geobacter sp. FeAm09]QEM68160.1 glycosyltransferase [Geobacter sp. FeAm09]